MNGLVVITLAYIGKCSNGEAHFTVLVKPCVLGRLTEVLIVAEPVVSKEVVGFLRGEVLGKVQHIWVLHCRTLGEGESGLHQ